MSVLGAESTSKSAAAFEVEPGAKQFVWIVWWSILIALLVLIGSYKVNIPIGDEWDHVAIISGQQPLSMDWLWSQEVNHRFPVAKLIWLLSLRVSDYDFHLLMFLDLLGLAALSCSLIRVATIVRGRPSYSDAFFPLVILNPSQWENLFSGFQLALVIPVISACSLVALIVLTRRVNILDGWRATVLACVCLVLLPVSTSAGLPFAGALSLWFGYLAISHLRSRVRTDCSKAQALLISSVISLLMIALYYRGYVHADYIPPVPSIGAALRTTIEFLGVSFGRGLATPYSGWSVVFLMIIGACSLFLTWRRSVQDRRSTFGLCIFLGATLFLALGIGQGRGGFGVGAGLPSRYVTLMLPALVCLYYIFEVCPTPGFSRSLQFFLFAGSCAALPLGVDDALRQRDEHNVQIQALEKDLSAGMQPTALVERYRAFLNPSWTAEHLDSAAEQIRMLHRAGVGVFRNLQDLRLVSIPISQSARDSRFDFALAEPQVVSTIRFRCTYESSDSPPTLRVSWTQGKSEPFDTARFTEIALSPRSSDQMITVSVNDTLNEFRVEPGTTVFGFQISELALLLPTNETRVAVATPVKGTLDLADSSQIAGWAWDSSHPDDRVELDIRDGNRQLNKVRADQFRQDLRDARIGDGKHSFSYPLPVITGDSKVHIIHAIVAGTGIELTGSPKAISRTNEQATKIAPPPATALITRTAAGGIDRLNDVNNPAPIPNAQHPFLLGAKKELIIAGWLADRADGRAFDEIYAIVSGRRIPATVQARPDVAAHFSNPALARSGFSITLTAANLGKDIQRIDLIGRIGKELYRMANPVYVDAR
jgi:hypothetical protein